MAKKDKYYSHTIPSTLKDVLLSYGETCLVRGEADFYGASTLIAEYAGFTNTPRSLSSWSHGVHFKDLKYVEQVNWDARWFKRRLVANERVKDFLKGFQVENVKAVGLPIVYVPGQNVVRQNNSILIMLAHSLPTTKVDHKLNEVVEFCKELQAKGHYVCFCVHADCYKQSNVTQTLDANKIDWFVGASVSDVNSLRRMRNIFEYFEVVGSNTIGSHFYYAQLFGAKFSFIEPFYEYKIEEVEKGALYSSADKRLRYTLKQSKKSSVKKKYPNYFMGYEKAVCNTALSEDMCGVRHKVLPEELTDLLGWGANNKMVHSLKYYSSRATNKLKASIKGRIN